MADDLLVVRCRDFSLLLMPIARLLTDRATAKWTMMNGCAHGSLCRCEFSCALCGVPMSLRNMVTNSEDNLDLLFFGIPKLSCMRV